MELEAAISQIKNLASTADEVGRIKIKNALQEAHSSLDTRFDILARVNYMPVQLSIARVGVDCGLFKALENSELPLKVDNLASTCGVAPEILGRILRYLASVGMVKETGLNEFTANAVTKALSTPDGEATVYLAFDSINLIFQELPDFLSQTKYQNLTDGAKTPFQTAFKTVLPAYGWLPRDPKRFAVGHQAMMAQREDWLDSFPIEKEAGDWSAEPDKALFVDIGGGGGHQCMRLRAKYPNLPGRIILQDTPTSISLVNPTKDFEATVHSFYDPQPVKGAKFYYLRNIIHDYTDDECVKILKNIIPALDKDSRILLDDMVLSNSGVHWRAAAADLTMMTSLAARERTRDEWYALMDRAGLEILNIHTYNVTVETSVVVAVPK